MAFLPPWLLVSLLILLPISTVAQSNGNITAGDSLIAAANSSPWLSPSGDFAFGFSPHSDKDFFLLSIWFANIPDRTIVWYANGDKPAPRGSKVELTADHGLGAFIQGRSILENISLTQEMVQSINKKVRGGNVVLKIDMAKAYDSVAWKFLIQVMAAFGFSEPVCCLVWQCISSPWYSVVMNGTSKGFFQGGRGLRHGPSRPTVMELSDHYWYCIFWCYDRRRELCASRLRIYYATLDFDGVFTLYSHPKASNSNRSWSPLWSVPENICVDSLVSEGIGVCGYNSICTLKADGRPMCRCPRGYSLLDPDDQYGSCKPDFIQGYLYTWEDLTNTDWPSSDYLLLRPYTEDKCRQSCLEDCMCAVAIFRLNNSCWKKKLPLSNGRVDSSLNGGKALIKIRKNNSTFQKKKKNQDTLILIGSLLGGSAFVNVIAVCLGFSFIYHKKLQKIIANASSVQLNLRCFTYKELEEATDGFKEELGKGSFGVVYKGTIRMGSSVHVAVKKLNNSFQDSEREFRTEVNVIGQTHHKNLVRLLGFCDEGQQRLLVYEFLSNGTLAGFLSGDLKPSWNRRIEIAIGIARGLLYLHEECSGRIIHCDIKPQNILLDDYYNALIADFGLAKLLMMNQSHTNTAIRGTKGYVAPDWFRHMPITAKVDVYSYGVMLLEIICCRKSVYMESDLEDKAILTDWACDCYQEGKLDALVEYDVEALDDRKRMEKFVKIAIWCIQEDPSLRPTMRKVTWMLEEVVEVPVPPCPSPFSKPG
ncbi:hypothetical protein I3842_13G166800 [Carya illinoinensis]|uniref:non-specific serine/threonine protein kinase n=1 Tax=Carya illinoinensis TaxID=32201 RepID=A0A922IU22_CARIL|nr:hypothetical protein I3842_13G166800 [Carya illinoinensis]